MQIRQHTHWKPPKCISCNTGLILPGIITTFVDGVGRPDFWPSGMTSLPSVRVTSMAGVPEVEVRPAFSIQLAEPARHRTRRRVNCFCRGGAVFGSSASSESLVSSAIVRQ